MYAFGALLHRIAYGKRLHGELTWRTHSHDREPAEQHGTRIFLLLSSRI